MRGCIYCGRCRVVEDGMSALPATLRMLRQRYCSGQYKECARYKVATKLGFGSVPPDLYPNQSMRLGTLLTARDFDALTPQGA